jgi:hypothetical protein
MAPWLVLALFGAAALAGLAGLARLATRRREWDDEEYERRRRTWRPIPAGGARSASG